MNFSKLQKTTSFFLLFFLFFSFTIRVPFLWLLWQDAYADDDAYYNLVSIIVQDDIYSWIKSELERYSRDIQNVLENTRVVILPAPSDASPFQVASLNESLYFEWYKSLSSSDFESRLVGTLLVWDLPVPFVFDGKSSSKTILPYTDFEDKAYIYDHEVWVYEKNQESEDDFSAEIWHWVIAPNSGDPKEDINRIKDYFDKNHDFYTWENAFQNPKGYLNWVLDDDSIEDYDPFVFYYDQFRETSAIQYQKYEWYKAYIENREDFTYDRYSKELAQSVSDQVLSGSSEDIQDLIWALDPDFPIDAFGSSPDVDNAPDIQTRHVADNSIEKFLEIFNSSALGDMRSLVHNAGRYNEWGKEVNVDIIPYLVSVLDEVNAQITKNATTDLENEIDRIVQNGLSRDIVIPVDIQTSWWDSCASTHTNFLYGTQAKDITNASECSVYRWSNAFSWTLVEANRGLNINNSTLDAQKLQDLRALQQSAGYKTRDLCNGADATWYWGWNSPLNLDTTSSELFALWAHNLKWGILPIFDIEWATEVADNSKVASPLDCFDNNYITTYDQTRERDDFRWFCETTWRLPINWASPVGWSCDSTNRVFNFTQSFDDLYLGKVANSCNGKYLVLDGESVACDGNLDTSGARYSYKKISSYVKHVSPTPSEFAAQLSNMVSPSLPIDKKRYIDFVAADGSYQTIDYPNLFVVDPETWADIALTWEDLKKELDRVSLQINAIRVNTNPNTLTWRNQSLYNLVKTWDFPNRDIDLYAFVQDKDLSVYRLNGDQKNINYSDTLTFAMYWNSLNTPSAKYKFIFENYLSNQFEGPSNFNLPKSKKSYEIAYLWAPGDHENMYIKLDPEGKSDNEYASVISSNITLDSLLLTSNLSSSIWDRDLEKKARFGQYDSTFACAPPDGVPIWEWIPAVTCWLNDMLPPTIWISEWQCGTTLLTDEELEQYQICEWDVNKNGVSDCIEWSLSNGNLNLSTDSEGYHYNKSWTLNVSLEDNEGKTFRLDNASYVNFELVKVEVPLDAAEEFTWSNTKVIFDASIPELSTNEAREEAGKYVGFQDTQMRVQSGHSTVYFTSKWSDSNIFFRTSLETKDNNGNEIISLESSIKEIQVRWDMFFASSYKLSPKFTEAESGESSIEVSDATNIYLVDENQNSVTDVQNAISSNSLAEEKIILNLGNISKAWNKLPLYYPISVNIEKDGETIFEQIDIQRGDLSSFIPLLAVQKSGTYDVKITNARWMTTNKELQILPGIATDLDVQLSTTVKEVDGNITTHVFTILDRFQNPTTGKLYTVNAKILWGWVEFQNKALSEQTFTTLEAYRAFRLKSTDKASVNKINFDLFSEDWTKITNITKTIRTLDEIQLDIQSASSEIKVWGDSYDFDITLSDKNNALLSEFDSRAYLVLNNLYGITENSYVEVKDGKGKLSLQTSRLAGQDVKLEFQIEWLNNIYKEYIDILPDVPMKLDFALSKWKIEASSDDSSVLEVALKDRYNNLVFNDDTTIFDIEIPEKYQDIITPVELSKKSSWGKSQFILKGTPTPWIARFKVGTSPSLSKNSFSLVGQAPFAKEKLDSFPTLRTDGLLTDIGKVLFREYGTDEYISQFNTEEELFANETYQGLASSFQDVIKNLWSETNIYTINGVWENAWSIETFYFWNTDNVLGNNYNALYSVLLGSSYGDITKQNYLASGLLFDKNNSALAVTSLLNDPYQRDDIISLHPDGNLLSLASHSDITQDINFWADVDADGKLIFDISNEALKTYIGKLYYNLPEDIGASVCEEKNVYDCIQGDDAQIIFDLKDESYVLDEDRGDITLKNAFWRELFSVSSEGIFDRKSNVYIEVNQDNKKSHLSLHLLSEDKIIAEVLVSLKNADININRGNDTLLKWKLANLKDTIILALQTNLYWTKDLHEWEDTIKKVLFYNDPFATTGKLDTFHESDEQGFENFSELAWAGWEEGNKTLLSLAAGKILWDATKDYASFSLINLWDPVFSLKKIQKTFLSSDEKKNFDATIWKLLSKSDDINSYQILDYNADKKDDILFVKSDGYIELLENKFIHGSTLDKWPLVYAADIWAHRFIRTWDFSGDGYEDIFFLNNKSEPFIFNNNQKDFVRISLEDIFALDGKIIQVETYDMDNDTNDDIITLDDSGKIHVFYGGGSDANPVFTKLKIWDGYGIELNSDTITGWAAVYFNWVPQVGNDASRQDIIESNEEYFANIGGDFSWWAQQSSIDESLLDRLIFVSVPYNSTWNSSLTWGEWVIQSFTASLPVSDDPDDITNSQNASEALADLISTHGNYIDYSDFSYTENTETTFVRSEYAENLWLKIEKIYTDVNQWLLQTGDLIETEIVISNTSWTTLRDIAYVDDIAKWFTLHSSEIEVVGLLDANTKVWPGSYDIILDGFDLAPWASVSLKYQLKTPSINFWHLQVGDFEVWNVGQDLFGDILLKESEENCGQEAIIYNSTWERSYAKWWSAPNCDTSKLELPGNLSDTAIDENGNGVPDYIDNLNSGWDDVVQGYMQGLLNDFNVDTDSDGIPDRDDSAPNIDQNDESIISSLSNFNENIDDITSDIDTIIEWFGCGFWGWSCIATPLNWAPLAPGSDPVLFWKPIGDGLRVDEGLPIFSSLTWFQIPWTGTTPPVCVPAIWPVSAKWYVPGPTCGPKSAWWKLGTWAPTNTVRIFATPTLTGWFGIAVCFGWPAMAAGYSNPPGIAPVVPGWNCIVAAVPLIGCDGENDGDPTSLGHPSYVAGLSWNWVGSSDGWYGIINGNCSSGWAHRNNTPSTLDQSAVSDYLEYRNGWSYSSDLETALTDALSRVARDGGNYYVSGWPVIDVAWGWEWNTNIDVEFDLDNATAGDFSDVVKVDLQRVSPFPNFLMDWVTRQMEEVVTKLTNLPKIFIILPDTSGVLDEWWGDFSKDLKKAFEEGQESKDSERSSNYQRVAELERQKASLDCSVEPTRCIQLEAEVNKLQAEARVEHWDTVSGIRSAYEFLWNVPLVAIESETIDVNVPWIDEASLQRAQINWKLTRDEWKEEVARAKESWSAGETCEAGDTQCQERNALAEKAIVDANTMISSLERNISILEDYKRFPEKLNQLINIKQTRLEQILCNVDAISAMLGGWIGNNGERFKAWVELFVLIKTILKSWQLVIDVFVDYEAECHECKNERQDLIGGTFQLVSAIIPKPPIIQFPKWPDIIMDLHSIRAGLVIYLPDFNLNLRPIVLPNLPTLRLPDTPTAALNLPGLPILPTFSIPELPDLPTLPSVELPDLPPPPKIPKLFGAVEWVLNILKLVTKVMCILKTSPFVPEWRAWDQIAYITERSGYLSTDFIDLSFPQFSYPFIDAFKITTQVNLEFETEFISEAVRNITAPLDTFTNDIANMFRISIADIDISAVAPSDVNINIDSNGSTDVDGLGAMNDMQKFVYSVVIMAANGFQNMLVYMDENKEITLSNKEFLAYVSESLAKESITSDPRTDELRALWEQVWDLTYSKEDALIENLLSTKNAKFETLRDILNTEKLKTDELKDYIKNAWKPSYITQVSLAEKTNLEAYNERLSIHNVGLIESAVQLVHGWPDAEVASIKEDGQELLTRVKWGIETFESEVVRPQLNLLADNHIAGSHSGPNSCEASGSSEYGYTYEWIYVLQGDNNYKLFDYTDELLGDEITTPIDIDSDGDQDLIYMVDGHVYLKENLYKDAVKTYVNLPALSLDSDDNRFFDGSTFYETINGFEEVNVSNESINAGFLAPTSWLENFEVEFYNRVDKSINTDNGGYVPENVKKYMVSAFAGIEENTLKARRDNIIMSQNLAQIDYVWKVPWAKLITEKLVNIKENVENNVLVTLSGNTPLYAGRNPFLVKYTVFWESELQEVSVSKYSHITFGEDVRITGITGNAYINTGEEEIIEWQSILTYIWKPLFPGTKIEFTDNGQVLTESAHIDIVSYEWTQTDIDFRKTYGYEIYDLGDSDPEDYTFRLDVPNDFYYAKILSFKNNVRGTHSNQILFSPQIEADNNAPELGLSSKISIPVYQQREIDLTPYIYEDGWVGNISDIWVDFDLETDSDNDGNPKNDRDTDKIEIQKTLNKIAISFGIYEELFEKKIRIGLEDKNGNTWERDIDFEVYAPEPEIEEYADGRVVWGLDEDLTGEPIRIYRYRWGAIQKLQERSGDDKILSALEWNYDFETPKTSSWLILTRDDADVAIINEYTWVVELKDPFSSVEVIASNAPWNEIGLPEIRVLYRWEQIFNEYIHIIETADIWIVGEFTDEMNNGMYLRFLDSEQYWYYKVPLGVPYNPGAVVIYSLADDTKQPLFTLFRDGRIDVKDTNYSLLYTSINGSVWFELYDAISDIKIWQVLLQVDGNYVLR